MVAQNLALERGGKSASYKEVGSVTVPEATDSYMPVPHAWLIDRAIETFSDAFGMEPMDASYGLARQGAQLFGVIRFRPGDQYADSCPVVGLRNSYDRTLSAAYATGDGVFVCDNLAFGGKFKVLRRHTKNVKADLTRMLLTAGSSAVREYAALSARFQSMKRIPLTEDQGFGFLGQLYGRGCLTTTGFTRAASYWKNPPHQQHSERNLFNWMQAATDGLKKTPPQHIFESHRVLQEYVGELL